jgi:hypothetical protein
MPLRVPGKESAAIDLNLHRSPFLAVIVQESGDRAARICVPLGGVIARTPVAGTPFEYASDGQRLTLSNSDDAEHIFQIVILS